MVNGPLKNRVVINSKHCFRGRLRAHVWYLELEVEICEESHKGTFDKKVGRLNFSSFLLFEGGIVSPRPFFSRECQNLYKNKNVGNIFFFFSVALWFFMLSSKSQLELRLKIEFSMAAISVRYRNMRYVGFYQRENIDPNV